MALGVSAEITCLVETLLSRVQRILGEQFVGMYLYGSLASGDFSPDTSDIDFLVVTVDSEQTAAAFEALRALHAQLLASGNPWAGKLEGAYVPRACLRRHAADAPAFPCTNEGQFFMAHMDSDWIIRRHLLLQAAIILSGPALSELIDPVPPGMIRQTLAGFLREWWQPMIERSPGVPFRLEDDEYQRYAVLTMCRILNSFQTGDFVSKKAAGLWALRSLDGRWQAVIQRALDWQPGQHMSALDESIELIRETISTVL